MLLPDSLLGGRGVERADGGVSQTKDRCSDFAVRHVCYDMIVNCDTMS